MLQYLLWYPWCHALFFPKTQHLLCNLCIRGCIRVAGGHGGCFNQPPCPFYCVHVLCVYLTPLLAQQGCSTIPSLSLSTSNLFYFILTCKFASMLLQNLHNKNLHMPPNNWETPMHLSLFTTFCPPQYFGLPTQYFWQVYASEHYMTLISNNNSSIILVILIYIIMITTLIGYSRTMCSKLFSNPDRYFLLHVNKNEIFVILLLLLFY